MGVLERIAEIENEVNDFKKKYNRINFNFNKKDE